MKKWMIYLCGINTVGLAAAIFLSEKEIVPTHFNFSGNADAWGNKWTYLLFAVIPIGIELSYRWRNRTMNQNDMILDNQKIERKLLSIITPMFIVLGGIFTYTALYGNGILGSFKYLIPALLGLVIVVISNDFGKIVQNRTLGIKVYWTLHDDTVWKKTHRLGGYLGVIGGLLLVVTGIAGYIVQNASVLAYGSGISMILVVVIPIFYSWRLYTRLHPKGQKS